jgi:hypothetical protein
MYGGAIALLNSPNGPFNSPYVTVSGHDVEINWQDVLPKAFKLVVGMYVGDGEAA